MYVTINLRTAVLPFYLLFSLTATTFFSCNGDISEESLAQYLRAKEHYESGALDASRMEFAALFKNHRKFYQAAFMEGKAAFFLGDVESAAEIFSKLNQKKPDHFDSAFWHARCLTQLGKTAGAEEEYLYLLSMNSQDPRILFQLALLKLEQEQIPDALDYLRRAALFGEEMAMMLIRLGRVYYRYGMFDEALEEMEKAKILLGRGHTLEQSILSLIVRIREAAESDPN